MLAAVRQYMRTLMYASAKLRQRKRLSSLACGSKGCFSTLWLHFSVAQRRCACRRAPKQSDIGHAAGQSQVMARSAAGPGCWHQGRWSVLTLPRCCRKSWWQTPSHSIQPSVLVEGHAASQGVEFLAEKQQKGLAPNTITYSAVSGRVDGQQPGEALKLVEGAGW